MLPQDFLLLVAYNKGSQKFQRDIMHWTIQEEHNQYFQKITKKQDEKDRRRICCNNSEKLYHLRVHTGTQKFLIPDTLIITVVVDSQAADKCNHFLHARFVKRAKFLWVDIKRTSFPIHYPILKLHVPNKTEQTQQLGGKKHLNRVPIFKKIIRIKRTRHKQCET